jgi:DNA-binding response OmpR family regulator
MTSAGRLLIVDDETPVLEVLSEYFAGQGYAIETASNGDDALKAARRRRPDLVLLDVRMPGMDGLETLRRLHALDASLPVIMVTANEDVGLARETLKIGAFDYVTKPFDFAYLDRAVLAGVLRGSPGTVDDVPAAVSAPTAVSATAGADHDGGAWAALATVAFRTARAMAAPAREATGGRLEAAALSAAAEAAVGTPASRSACFIDGLSRHSQAVRTDVPGIVQASRTCAVARVCASTVASIRSTQTLSCTWRTARVIDSTSVTDDTRS